MQTLINKGFQYSGCYNLNLLKKSNNIYIMDNHGAALWAWLQHINPDQKYSLIHIDKHYDTTYSRLDEWFDSLRKHDLPNLTIEEFYSIKDPQKGLAGESLSTIRWDNYIPLFERIHGKNLASYIFYTHKEGSSGTRAFDPQNVREWQPHHLIENLDYLISETEDKTILNLDIDYFFLSHNEKYFQFITDEAIDVIFEQIKHSYLETDKIEVFTVALSPECCGGWENSLRIYNLLADKLQLDHITMQ